MHRLAGLGLRLALTLALTLTPLRAKKDAIYKAKGRVTETLSPSPFNRRSQACWRGEHDARTQAAVSMDTTVSQLVQLHTRLQGMEHLQAQLAASAHDVQATITTLTEELRLETLRQADATGE